MVHTKGAHCDHCCCAECGVRAEKDVRKNCCYCMCDELCVKIAMDELEPSPCDANCECDVTTCGCADGRGILSWDPVNCHWTGIVSCGTVSFSLTVKMHWCDPTCYLCVTSTCLGMAGDCDTTTDCFTLSDCGEYGVDCDVTGGFTFSFTKDISDAACGDPDCGDADITISCTNFVNPNHHATDNYEICRDCNCVCETVCITYTENGCSITKAVVWDDGNNRWQTTFDGQCPWSAQTVTITLVADNDNCCKFRLTTTRGTVDSPDEVDAECPHPTLSWVLTDITATVDVECSICDECPVASVCCPDDLPEKLYARICTPCGDTACVVLNLVAQTATTALWRSTGTVTVKCTDSVDFICYDIDIGEIEFECLSGGTLWEINIYCSTTLIDSATALTVDCDPFCVEGSFTWNPNEVVCNYAGGADCADDFKICISEQPCP